MSKPATEKDRIRNLPIGIFDSGLGGLTVVKQITGILPDESIIYFGDTARLPYGTKSYQTIKKFSIQIADFLFNQGVKMIVVACNTVSSVALEMLKERCPIPVVGVIEPGAKTAINLSENRRIGIIGTEATINSKAYERVIKSIDKGADVFSIACPLFVPLVEEGMTNSNIVLEVARLYLKGLSDKNIDTLILGCTHYPLIKDVIREAMDNRINIIDSSIEIALEVKRILQKEELLSDGARTPSYKFYVTDLPQKFELIAQRFLGRPLSDVEYIPEDSI